MTLEYEELTGKIIAPAMAVHKELGPGLVESGKAGDDARLALTSFLGSLEVL